MLPPFEDKLKNPVDAPLMTMSAAVVMSPVALTARDDNEVVPMVTVELPCVIVMVPEVAPNVTCPLPRLSVTPPVLFIVPVPPPTVPVPLAKSVMPPFAVRLLVE